MSIESHSPTEITNAGFHYTSLPTELGRLIAEKYGLEAVGLWWLFTGMSKDYVINKQHACDKYHLSPARFTKAMRALETFELAWIEARPRQTSGKLGGKSWTISNLPKSVTEALNKAIDFMRNITDPIENEGVGKTDINRPPIKPRGQKTEGSETWGDISKDQSLSKDQERSSDLANQKLPPALRPKKKQKATTAEFLNFKDGFEQAPVKIGCQTIGVQTEWDSFINHYTLNGRTKTLSSWISAWERWLVKGLEHESNKTRQNSAQELESNKIDDTKEALNKIIDGLVTKKSQMTNSVWCDIQERILHKGFKKPDTYKKLSSLGFVVLP